MIYPQYMLAAFNELMLADGRGDIAIIYRYE
jgi:hypothetical protein